MSLTLNRLTTLEFEPVTQYLLNRPTWYLKRRAHEIARGERAGRKRAKNTRLEPRINAWRLTGALDEIGAATSSDFSSAAIPASALNLADGVSSYDTFRSPSDLSGVSPNASVISSGVTGYRRTIAAGSTWDATLQQSDPAPPADADVTAMIPLTRMIASKVTYPPNCGFVVTFAGLPGPGFQGGPPGPRWRLYFGGATERRPSNFIGGGFCLEDLGGRSALWEYMNIDGAFSWKRRLEIPLRQGTGVGFVSWSVLPLGRANILIQSLSFDNLVGEDALTRLKRDGLPTVAYRNNRGLTGCDPVRYITGAGTMGIDVRRDYRGQVALYRNIYHTSGYVQDLPFLVPWPVIPAGTILTLKVSAELVPGSDIAIQLFDATDDSEISPTGAAVGNGVIQADYSLGANQGKLYVKITLTSDTGDQTPLLHGYEVEVAGLRETRVPTVTTGGVLRSVSISGPDYDPSQAQAKAVVKDVTAQLNSLLLARGAVHGRIKTQYDALGNTTILHEGILLDARAKLRGKTGMTYPSPNWRDYELTFGSMWVRVQRQLNLSVERFAEDPDAPEDPTTGVRPPWKITDIIRYCLRKLGWPDSQLDIPDLNLRLWPAQATLEDLTLYPAVSFAEFLIRLSRDYLGMVLLWDPNAGAANGMWRLLYNPSAPYTSLATFSAGAAAGKVQSHPNSYGASETFIINDTYDSWVVPPEANFIIVTATGELLPSDGGSKLLVARIYNPLSFNFDPANPTADATHPDYLGDIVPLLYFDPTLTEPAAVAYVARRLYDRVAHGEKWFTFQAPALYVGDASDSQLSGRKRPLRINDVITVLGSTALVRSASYGYDRDNRQLMTIEGRFLT